MFHFHKNVKVEFLGNVFLELFLSKGEKLFRDTLHCAR